jgi:hypothetical protein
MTKYYNQYIKCLNKYLELKCQIGGALDDMPNIAIGNCATFWKYGCRHIDGANAYANVSFNANYIIKMKEIINQLTESNNIKEIIQELDCGYISLWLVHHSRSKTKTSSSN